MRLTRRFARLFPLVQQSLIGIDNGLEHVDFGQWNREELHTYESGANVTNERSEMENL